ncbi:hypothetical protein PG994_002565 [Apiospora phragmitis]|uniref:NACHT domain-containing protein n=1 Tax=Apiospora phragmitis TaxID=2905665 RepID=A0ABR1W5M8_9PEZI
MLSLSQSSSDARVKAVVKSTAAVVFLGTPHRGSQWAQLGESVSKVVSSLGFDTSPNLLTALGLGASDLQRSQDAFSAIWNKYTFRVKTFQEGQGLKGTRLGGLDNKIVDISSSLGDEREQAEVLNANQREICLFSGPRDPNLIKILAEIADICSFSLDGGPNNPSRADGLQGRMLPVDTHEQEPNIMLCNGNPGPNTQPILWIKGAPGEGKTTAIRNVLQKLSAEEQFNHIRLASFFFNSQAQNQLLRSPLGLLRSLLCQLLPQDRRAMAKAIKWHRWRLADNQHKSVVWNQIQLAQMIKGLFADGSQQTIILIDAMDECGSEDNNLWLINFFHDLILKDSVRLRLCLTTRHLSALTLQGCSYIVAELENGSDIRQYLDKKLQRYQRRGEDEFKVIKEDSQELSFGIFLWVVLATDCLVKDIVKGKRGIFHLKRLLKNVPNYLSSLYDSLVTNAENPGWPLRVLQWAVFTRRLTLREWRYLLPVLRRSEPHHLVPHSLSQCRRSEYWATDDEDLADLICNLSMGLVRVLENPSSHSMGAGVISAGGKSQNDRTSLGGRAGSLESEEGDTRFVSVIHGSVAEFFKKPRDNDELGRCHLDIMDTCLDIIAVRELDELVDARFQLGHPETYISSYEDTDQGCSTKRSRIRRGDSVRSFTSASSHGSRRLAIPVPDDTPDDAHGMETAAKSPTDLGSETDLSRYLSITEGLSSENAQRQFRLQLLSCRDSEDKNASPVTKEVVHEPALTVASTGDFSVCVLPDYPDIINYSISGFSFHAYEAQHYGADSFEIIRALLEDNGKLWKRWLCLSEDKPYDTTLMHWARFEGLFTWLDIIENANPEEPRPSDTDGHSTPSRGSQACSSENVSDTAEDDPTR